MYDGTLHFCSRVNKYLFVSQCCLSVTFQNDKLMRLKFAAGMMYGLENVYIAYAPEICFSLLAQRPLTFNPTFLETF